MISVFDLDKLRGLLKDFYQISRIRITVFDEDLNELCSYPERVPPCTKGRFGLFVKDIEKSFPHFFADRSFSSSRMTLSLMRSVLV